MPIFAGMGKRDRAEKAKAVRLVKDDGRIHLAAAGRFTPKPNGFEPAQRLTLCDKPAMLGVLPGLPTSQPVAARCPACFSAIDAYGYPKELAR